MLLSGCAHRVGDLTALSTRNVSLNKIDIDTLPQSKAVEGRSSAFMLLFIPLGIPHLEDAVDDALNKGDGDLMLDPVIYMGGWWFIVGESSITVKGNVVNTKGGKVQ